MKKTKTLVFALTATLLFIGQALAETKFEGTYHSAKDVNEKINITKTDNNQYLIKNETKKWKAVAFKGIQIDSKSNQPTDYYKGVISWDKNEKTNVGFIAMSLMEDGKSIHVLHRWNFWKDAKNGSDPWEETWTKEN